MKLAILVLFLGFTVVGITYQLAQRQKESVLHFFRLSFATPHFVDTDSNKAKATWQGKYWKVSDAGEILKNTSKATVATWFKVQRVHGVPQDLIAISVGGTSSLSLASRVSVRLQDQALIGIIRARDNDEASNVSTQALKVNPGEWNQVVMTVDYARNSVQIYLNGVSQQVNNQPKFSQSHTSDTDSISIALGSEDDGSTNFIDGELREVRVWRKVLNSKDVKELYQESKNLL